MDNPYWTSSGRTHHISLDAIESLSFNLLNIFGGSKSLADEMMAIETEAIEHGEECDLANSKLWSLQTKLAENRISESLLQLALLVRTYDDLMKGSSVADDYATHAEATSGENFVGVLGGAAFDLRQACNKVIHATTIRPLYEDVDPFVVEGGEDQQRIWYLTGEIELSGRLGNNHWLAIVHTQPFIETVLDRIAFGAPPVNIENV